jgi:hypothetical protein
MGAGGMGTGGMGTGGMGTGGMGTGTGGGGAGCMSAADCPAAGSACLKATCSAGICGTAPVPAGTLTPNQKAGDCKREQCDGTGNAVAVNDDADVPVDGNGCTGDVCTAGVPSNPALAAGTACNDNGGQVCDGSGMCVMSPPAGSCTGAVVISQVYGAGGNAGAVYKNDFVELYNRGDTTVSLAGWSVQYASAAGTTWLVTNLSGSIAPGGYYLVQGAGGATGKALPAPDATGNTNMSASAGKLALVNSTTALSGACPSGAKIVDLLGFGATASCSEGMAATGAASASESLQRLGAGCTDTGSNAADFASAAVAPRNTASTPSACVCMP